MSVFVLIEAMEAEGLGGVVWSRQPSGILQVADVFEGRDDGGAGVGAGTWALDRDPSEVSWTITPAVLSWTSSSAA
jgi:hypothetical protein